MCLRFGVLQFRFLQVNSRIPCFNMRHKGPSMPAAELSLSLSLSTARWSRVLGMEPRRSVYRLPGYNIKLKGALLGRQQKARVCSQVGLDSCRSTQDDCDILTPHSPNRACLPDIAPGQSQPRITPGTFQRWRSGSWQSPSIGRWQS